MATAATAAVSSRTTTTFDLPGFRVVTSWEQLAAKKEEQLRACHKRIDTLEKEVLMAKEEAREHERKLAEAEERRKREKRALAEELALDAEARLRQECEMRGRTSEALDETERKLMHKEAELARVLQAEQERKADDRGVAKGLERLRAKYDKELTRRKELEVIHRAALERERKLRVKNGELELLLETLESEVAAAEVHYAALAKTSRESAMNTQRQVFALRTALLVLGAELKDDKLVGRLLAEAGDVVDREKNKQ